MSEQDVSQRHARSATRARILGKLHRYRRLFLGKWWVLFLMALAGIGVAWVVSKFQAPLYASFGRMIVNVRLSLPEGSVYTEEVGSFVGTQAALMQSGVVVNRAHMRVTSTDASMVMQPVKLKVTLVPRTTIFVLQGVGTNASYTKQFVQACMEEYIALKREMRSQTSDTTVAGLTEEVLRLKRELKDADDELVAFQSTNSVVLLQEQGNTAGNWLATLNQKLAALRSEYELLKALTLEQNLERRQQDASSGYVLGTGSELPDRSTAVIDSDYLRAKQQILLLKAEEEEMSEYLRPKHPKMIAMKEEIARREKLLEIFKKQSAEQLESRKSSLALQIENVEKDIEEWDTKTLDVSRKSAEFTRLKANVQRIQALYDRLLATMQTIDVNKEISPESVTIMEDASDPLPENPAFSTMLVAGAIVGMLAAVGLLLLLDRMDDRVSSLSELNDVFDEEILGQVPRERPNTPRGSVQLIQPNDERHSFVEAYRNLRSSLYFLSDGAEKPKIILFTSSIPNEGKSLTSANFAVSLAHAGQRVLLIDADLRKGSLHSRFGLKGEPGLTEVLSEGLSWEKATHATKVPNLSLLPRGTITHRSSEFFLDQVTKNFLDDIRGKFDSIIIDTAPVMAADDVTSLAPLADGVVFVFRAEYTSARVGRASIDSLYQRQAKVLGVVFNSVRPTNADYYYYYKYSDYSSEMDTPAAKPGERSKSEVQS